MHIEIMWAESKKTLGKMAWSKVHSWLLFLISVKNFLGVLVHLIVFWNILHYSVAFGHSSTRVILINWKCSSLAHFVALLLLNGDVSQNSGPPEVFSCGVWTLEVSDSNAAVCCDYFDHWIHVLCDPLLSMDNYNNIVSNSSTEPWFCFYCKESLSKHVGESSNAISALSDISCVCLNPHSVVSERFDLYLFVDSICMFLLPVLT